MILSELKVYVNLLTSIPLNQIVFGRNGYDRTNLNWSGAHIDELAILPVGKHDDFNEVTEIRTLTTSYNGVFTIDFYGNAGSDTVNLYGNNALENSSTFFNMQGSLESYEWQRDNDIRISHSERIINLKAFAKGSNQDRYQVELKANFTKSTSITTKRIDTANITFINEE